MAKEYDYIGRDSDGTAYNAKYPADPERYGTLYHGYKNGAAEVLFNDFAVSGYDAYFEYHGKEYRLLYYTDHAALTDEGYSNEYEVFPDPNTLIENLRIEGRRLIDIIDDIDYAEAM